MTVAAVSSNFMSSVPSIQSGSSRIQQFKQGFDQLGQDIQSGNLSAAQEEFANLPKPGAGQTSQTSSPIEQSFAALQQNLQSGDLTAAAQDYSQIHGDIQNRIAHRYSGDDGGSPSPAQPAAPVTSPLFTGLSVNA